MWIAPPPYKPNIAFISAESASRIPVSQYYINAFTLAEVLITLGIIGVVAAMTLPALIHNYKYHVLQVQLKAAYSDLNNAAKMFQIHNDMSVSEYAEINTEKQTLLQFQKELSIVIKSSDLNYSSTDSDGNSIGAAPYRWGVISNYYQKLASTCDRSGFIWDAKGRTISFDDSPNNGENGPKVCIDINGEQKPNVYGIDYFIFMFTVDGYVIPWGKEHPNNPPECPGTTNYYNCTIQLNKCDFSDQPYACANYALINQHPNKNGKSYWKDFLSRK